MQDVEGDFPALQATNEQAVALWEAAEAVLAAEPEGAGVDDSAAAEEEEANHGRLLSSPKAMLLLSLARLALSQACFSHYLHEVL